MATNQTRREAAKRKLENQQRRRVERAQRRQRIAIVASAAAVVVIVVGAVVLATTLGGDQTPAEPAGGATPAPEATPSATPAALGDCTFTPTPDQPAAKPAPVPDVTSAPTSGTVPVTLHTNRGDVPLTLDRSTGPCAVVNFLSLANADYYTGTPCHRLTTSAALKVLQCGDPTGTGKGGPGYTINDEPPTGLAPAGGDSGAVVYPRGTLAMAKTSQPDSGGSQFFLVYSDSTLPPDYTVFGTVGEAGLAVLDGIAAGGLAEGSKPGDGAPREPVTIEGVTTPA